MRFSAEDIKMSYIKVIENAKVVLENGIIFDGVIVIEDEHIKAVGARGRVGIPDGAEHIDAKGAYVGPGFVDIHVHGGNGATTYFEAASACDFFLSHGETTVFATPSYDLNFEETVKAIRSCRKALGEIKNLRGIYMEGPYTNPNYGSHAYQNPWRHPINEEQYKQLCDEGGRDIKVWTVAPEREGIMGFLEYARAVNPDVIFSVGHSEATPEQIRRMGKYKPTILTHAMNATGRIPVPGGTRAYGPDEYALKEPDVYCELISDSQCMHVNSELQQLILFTKGIDRVILITDSTTHDDPNPPAFSHIDDLNFDANGGIAGSKMTMDKVCRNIMMHTNTGIAQAFKMASTTPAKAVGMDDEVGSIEVGKRADLVFVDDVFNVKTVMLSGEICKFD